VLTLRLLMAVFGGRLQREQADVIASLREENRLPDRYYSVTSDFTRRSARDLFARLTPHALKALGSRLTTFIETLTAGLGRPERRTATSQ
jgi:hypothetical protein